MADLERKRTLPKKQRYPICYLQLERSFNGKTCVRMEKKTRSIVRAGFLLRVNEWSFLYSVVDLMFHLYLNIVKLFRLSQLHMQFVFSC